MFLEKNSFIALLALLIASAAIHTAGAADIYRWVDENGLTHIADIVPTRYKRVATKVDTSASKVSKQQRATAIQRAEKVKNAARESTAAPSATSPVPSHKSSNSDHPDGVSLEPGTATHKNDDEDAECARLRREYDESQACFVQFATQSGIKGEAYDHCKSVPDPSPRCGLTTN